MFDNHIFLKLEEDEFTTSNEKVGELLKAFT